MTLEEHIQALITQYQKLQNRHKMRADNAYYQFQSEMWQAMSDDYAIMVEDLQQALENAIIITDELVKREPAYLYKVFDSSMNVVYMR